MKARGWWLMGALALALAAPSPAAPGGGGQLDQLTFSASFDDLFLYVAFTSADIDLRGREERYGYPVTGDDAVELLLDITPSARSGADRQTLYRGCFKLGLSVSGGIFLAVGGGDARRPEWLPLRPSGRTGPALRADLALDGTLNDGSDVDRGWSVEAAIPWQRLGLEGPPLGDLWAYNVVRTLRGDADAGFSLAEGGSDVDPSRWLPLSFRQGPAGLEAGNAFLVFSQAEGQNPTVDGNVTETEWPVLQRVELTPSGDRLTALQPVSWPLVEEVQAPLPAGSTFQPRELAPAAPRGPWLGDSLVLATYQLDLCSERSHDAVDDNGASLLAAHPLGGLGPQNSAQRVGAHGPQLQRAAAAGIDVLLIAWPGAQAARDAWALGALRSLALAATQSGQGSATVPLLAPRINVAELAERVDLTQQAQAELLFAALAEFYQQVPPHLRAQVADGPRRELLVDLGAAPAATRLSASFQTYVEQRFRETFGVEVAWLGDALWARRGARLDGARTVDGGPPVFAGGAERVRLGVVRPGRDELRSGGPLVQRRGFEALRASFDATVAGKADWLLLDSWNDLRAGTQLTRTREWGAGYERRAGGLAAEFANPSEQNVVARVRRLDAPPRVASGGRLLVTTQMANAGLQAWSAQSDIRLAALWHRAEPAPLLEDGKPVVDRMTGRPVMTDEPINEKRYQSDTLTAEPGGATEAELAVEAIDSLGQPLPPGRYRLRFSVLAGTRVENQPVLDDKGQPVRDEKGRPRTTRVELPNVLGTQGDRGLDLPIEVVAPEQLPELAATVLSADLPSRVETGRLYPLTVTLRNDGRLPWPEGCRVGVRYELLERAEPNAAPAEPQAVTGWVPCGPIATVVSPQGRRGAEPGQSSTVRLKLPTADASGKPLPVDAGPRRVCRARLALLDRAGQPVPSSLPWFQAVEVLARDWGSGIANVDVPRLLQAGSSVSGAVTVQNTAFRTWAQGHCELSWSWYRFDGAELKLDAGRAPVPVEVRSGQATKVPVTIVAPAYTGPLLLAFDLVHEGTLFGSRQPSTYESDLAVEPVVVVGGPYRPLSLAAQLNVVGHALETGDMNGSGLDGQGRFLPAELVPPTADDVADGLYPTGWLSQFGGTARHGAATFRYPAPVGPDSKPVPSVLRPDGQVITVVPGSYLRLHVLGAAVRGEVTTRFGIVDAKGAVGQSAPVTITNWDQSPRHGETVGLRLPYRATRLGAEQRPAWLHHIVVPLDPSLTLARLVMPRAADLRILALTLEAAPAAAGPPAPNTQP